MIAIESEAAAAHAAVERLTDDAVAAALEDAAGRLAERRDSVLAANAADVDAAAGARRGRARPAPARRARASARSSGSSRRWPRSRRSSGRSQRWTLDNGLRVSERRIPVGAVGANFEARPNVAVDVAAQLLKSLNTAVLRTGGAALRDRHGARRRGAAAGARGRGPAAGRRRPRAHARPRGRARARLAAEARPARDPARQRPRRPPRSRGSPRRTASARSRTPRAAASSTCTRRPTRRRRAALVEASLDRLGVCNRLNLAARRPRRGAPARALLVRRWPRGARRCRGEPLDGRSATSGRTTPSASRRSRCARRRRSTRRCGSRTTRRRASPRASSPRTRPRRERSSTRYRGTAAFWHATTRFTDGFALTGAPETGINVDWAPGPRGPVTYRDLWLRQYRVVGDGTQHR